MMSQKEYDGIVNNCLSNSKFPPDEPMLAHQGLKVKPPCECSECDYWVHSVDWTTSNITEKPGKVKRCRNAIQPFFSSDKYPRSIQYISSFNKSNMTKIEKQKSLNALVHSDIIPQAADSLADTHFAEEVQRSLNLLNYKRSKSIQAFVWPALYKEMNVFMVGSAKCGKTLAYLPAICSFALDTENPHYIELNQHRGPLIIIVCSNSKQCEEVTFLMEKLYQTLNRNEKPNIVTMTYPIFKTKYVDILITLPQTLVECLKSNMFNLKRLCHLVLENTSILLTKHKDSVNAILKVVNEMTEHRLTSKKVQFIVSSEQWITEMGSLLGKMYSLPLISIENHLEAALYGDVDFEFKFEDSRNKIVHVLKVINEKYKCHKTLIICSNDEIDRLNEEMKQNKIETFCLSDSSDKDLIEEYELRWNNAVGGDFKVLLCTDFIFESFLTINDAMLLIHYSFPVTWTRFVKRFSAIHKHINCPIQKSESAVNCQTLVLIDESCEKQMLKVLNLLNRLNENLPDNFKRYAKNVKIKIENEKMSNGIDLCPQLKLLGLCSDQFCSNRHIVKESWDIQDTLPMEGKITFKILSFKHVTSYAIQILEHVDVNKKVYKFSNDNLKMPLIYQEGETPIRSDNVKLNQFYAYCEHRLNSDLFTLCEVLEIMNEDVVEVRLQNTGHIMQTQKKKLYQVPSHIKIAQMLLSNLVPPFSDLQFSASSNKIAHSALINSDYRDMVLSGEVHLHLNGTLWLDSVTEIVKSANIDLIRFNLSTFLLGKKVAVTSPIQMESLYKLCKTCQVKLPTVSEEARKVVKRKPVEPDWAFLDGDVTEVRLSSAVSPDEFYIHIAKFQSLLEQLQRDIQDSLSSDFIEKRPDVTVGAYYLALDHRSGEYGRALILNKTSTQCLCFFVDYGDEAVVDLANIKILPSKFITRLPFQAIQCRLYGISQISPDCTDNATDVLYRYMFEPDSDIFRSLYLKVCDQMPSANTRTKTTYSVILKDAFNSKNCTINQILIDCGFAVLSNGTKAIENFDLPQTIENGSSVESDDEPFSIDENNPEDTEFNIKEMELEIVDIPEFINSFPVVSNFMKIIKPNSNPLPIEDGNVAISEIPEEKPLKHAEIVEETRNLTPEVFWTQSDHFVRMKIKLVGIREYKVNIARKRIFTFLGKLEDKIYELNFTLFKPAEISKHSDKGQEIVVVLAKKDKEEWMQLTATEKRRRNIHYEYPDVKDDVERKKLLTLGISDDESDNEIDDRMMYVNDSDMDSEFDQDIKSDED